MGDSYRDQLPADLAEIARRLESERAVASPAELDRVKLRALRQAQRPAPTFLATNKGPLMKSRLALLLMIVAGLMMSMTGATLAISGNSGSGSAAVSQYNVVSPEEETLGDDESGAAPEAEQVAVAGDEGSSLPFTGFVAIPLLLGGVALVFAGSFLRRKAS